MIGIARLLVPLAAAGLLLGGGVLVLALRELSAAGGSQAVRRRIVRGNLIFSGSWILLVLAASVVLRGRGVAPETRELLRTFFPLLVALVPLSSWCISQAMVSSAEEGRSRDGRRRRLHPLALSAGFIGMVAVGMLLALAGLHGGVGWRSVLAMVLVFWWWQLTLPRWMAHSADVTPLTQPELREGLLGLAQRAGVTLREFLCIDDLDDDEPPEPQAMAIGQRRSQRVFVTSSLLATLTPEQTVAVVAHEVAHHLRRHLLKRMLVSLACYGLFIAVVDALEPAGPLARLLATIVLAAVLWPLVLRWYGRRCELEADRVGGELSDPLALAEALAALPPEPEPRWLPAPLARAYASHPERERRVELLRAQARSS